MSNMLCEISTCSSLNFLRPDSYAVNRLSCSHASEKRSGEATARINPFMGLVPEATRHKSLLSAKGMVVSSTRGLIIRFNALSKRISC